MRQREWISHDHTPEDVLRMIAYIKLVETIPVIFDGADGFLCICIEKFFELFLGRWNNAFCPHNVTDQMKEITQTETIWLDAIFRFDVCQILLVIDEIVNLMFIL